MTRVGSYAIAVAAAALATLAGCGNEETLVSPVEAGGGGGTAGAAGGAGDAAPPPADAGTPVRTVEQRNPFGDTTIEPNLFVDGDFELTSANGQYGWIAFTGGAQADLVRETGGLCRSGVTCGVMTAGTELMAYGAAPPDKSFEVSLWVKPPATDCTVVLVSLISCVNEHHTFATVDAVGSQPGPDGWCQYKAVSSPMDEEPCIVIVTSAAQGERVLIDDASLVPVASSGSKALAATVPDPDLFARVGRMLDWVNRHRRYGRPAPGRP